MAAETAAAAAGPERADFRAANDASSTYLVETLYEAVRVARRERREVATVRSVTASTERERKLAMAMMKVFWKKGAMAWSRVRPG